MTSVPHFRRAAAPALTMALTLALGAACSDATGPQVIEEVEFAASLGIDLSQMTRTPEGIYFQDVVEGVGDGVQDGAVIEIEYIGWLTNGSEFDRGSFEFTLGETGFIAGWNLGIRGMKLDGTRKIVIPPELAYGDSGSGPIPGGAILIFQIELTAIN